MPRKDADCWCNTVNATDVMGEDGVHAAWCEKYQSLERERAEAFKMIDLLTEGLKQKGRECDDLRAYMLTLADEIEARFGIGVMSAWIAKRLREKAASSPTSAPTDEQAFRDRLAKSMERNKPILDKLRDEGD